MIHPCDQDFLDVLAKFGLKPIRITHPGFGGVSYTRLVDADKGKFVLKMNPWRTKAQVEFEIDVLLHLAACGFSSPKPVKASNGECVVMHNEMPCAVFISIKGSSASSLTQNLCCQVAQYAAQLQKLTTGFIPVNADLRWNYTKAFCLEKAGHQASKLGTLNAQSKLSWFKETVASIELPDELPKSICHCDYDPSNVLVDQGLFASMIDYDVCNLTSSIVDCAFLINPFIEGFDWNTWEGCCFKGLPFDFRLPSLIIASYEKVRSLSDSEKLHLFDAYKLAVLIDCLWFFDRGSWKSFFERKKIELLDALGRQNFTESVFKASDHSLASI